VFRFCRSKCHKNFKAKRNPRKVRWTKAYRKTHGKELTVDPVFEFEKQKDTTVKYNRDTWVNTIQAMERLDKIRTDREARFWERRMKNAENHKKEMIKSNLIRNEALIADPKIRKKVEKLKEERDEKREAKRMKKITHKTEDLNLGLDDEMKDVEEGNNQAEEKVYKENITIKKRKKQKIALRQKLINKKKHIKV
jgi:large subunit ribosomal protein L24e